jgi:hypothetical protein
MRTGRDGYPVRSGQGRELLTGCRLGTAAEEKEGARERPQQPVKEEALSVRTRACR